MRVRRSARSSSGTSTLNGRISVVLSIVAILPSVFWAPHAPTSITEIVASGERG